MESIAAVFAPAPAPAAAALDSIFYRSTGSLVAQTTEKLRFACSHEGCSKTYTAPTTLAHHVRSQHAAIPYKCTVPGCTAEFKTYDQRNTHARWHKAALAAADVPTYVAIQQPIVVADIFPQEVDEPAAKRARTDDDAAAAAAAASSADLLPATGEFTTTGGSTARVTALLTLSTVAACRLRRRGGADGRRRRAVGRAGALRDVLDAPQRGPPHRDNLPRPPCGRGTGRGQGPARCEPQGVRVGAEGRAGILGNRGQALVTRL